jgi:hypothetical protein
MFIRILLLALLPAFAPCAPLGELPPDAIIVETIDPGVADRADRLGRRARGLLATSAESAVAALTSESDALLRELAAAAVLDVLRTELPTPDSLRLVEWLASQPDRVFTRHEETAGDWFVPLLDIAARANGTLLLWQHGSERAAWVARMEQPAAGLWAELEGVSGSAVERAAEALFELDPAAYSALRTATRTHALPSPLRVAIALRSPDRESYASAWSVGDARQRLALVERAAEVLPAADALEFLQRATDDPAQASAAVIAVAALSEREQAAHAVLLQALDDPVLGPSAAAGLARGAAHGRVERITALLDADASVTKARHLALALRLDGSPAAREMLQRWARDPQVPASLRSELEP